jgi:hypothetical protein
MKTITYKSSFFGMSVDNPSFLLCEDDEAITVDGDTLITPAVTFLNMPEDGYMIHKDVTAPDDWSPMRYLFDGASWVVNPEWKTDEQHRAATTRIR